VNRGGVRGKAVDDLSTTAAGRCLARLSEHRPHGQFFDCVKTRKQPCTPVPVKHRSSTACHLTNISLRLEAELTWDAAKEQIVGDDEANAWQTRQQRAPYVVSG